MEKYYLTTPLYYVNSKPHIGHAYTEIAADTLARYHRIAGREVLFLTGTDEHGQKVAKAAADAGLAPGEFTDKISGTFKDLWRALDISYDDFIRTTEPRHIAAVRAVWQKLEKAGEVYKAVYSGWYCTPCETFWTEGQVLPEGGRTLCPDCKRPIERLEEENYFFKISGHRQWLIDEIRRAENFRILPDTRRNEVLGFLEHNALQDLCISRPKSRMPWGIPSPLSDSHVTYVWFDALINYISAVGFGADEKKLARWWPADAHLIGKDILRHHAVYWTILLRALGLKLPRLIFAHGWWVQGGEKMSKSRGNVIDPVEIAKTYGVDAFRYFLLRETAFGQDGVFSEEAFILRYNTDLANDLGNLLHRTLTMCEKYFDGSVPAGVSSRCAGELKEGVDLLESKLSRSLEKLAFSDALAEIWALVGQANKFIESSAPWTLAREKKTGELKVVIVSLAEAIKAVAQALWPFMPSTAEGIWRQLGIAEPVAKASFKKNLWGYFEKGGQVAKGAPLFPRIETKREGLR
ncbi:MAG: methionine--tRNA ligase [Candidatus Omnitrophica bacterium]|nr:methionine--tRNA ligase [Candidatus Omnitrophota bacterium]